jgi:hypothetical protein
MTGPPSAFTGVVAMVKIADRIAGRQQWRASLSAQRLRALVAAANAGVLVHELQGERAAAGALLAGQPDATEMNAYLQQVSVTDAAIGRYRT